MEVSDAFFRENLRWCERGKEYADTETQGERIEVIEKDLRLCVMTAPTSTGA
jgi:hypothetical protein